MLLLGLGYTLYDLRVVPCFPAAGIGGQDHSSAVRPPGSRMAGEQAGVWRGSGAEEGSGSPLGRLVQGSV